MRRGKEVSGHNKWTNIKQKKGKEDAKRGRIFTKYSKEIIVAVKTGGSDPAMNMRLKTAVEKAKASNMPNDTIDRAIKKGAGELDGVNYEEFNYEGYGPGGVAVYLDIMTDNRNRTAGDIRHIFSKNGGSLGETGCVGWMFDKKGLITIPKDGMTEDELMLYALEAGAEDVVDEVESFEVYTDFGDLQDVRKGLEDEGLHVATSELTMVPQNTVAIEGKQVEQFLKLIDALEDHDDVQNVYSNADISDEEMERIGG